MASYHRAKICTAHGRAILCIVSKMGTFLGRRGLQHVAELTQLEHINLSDTAISDTGMPAMAPLKRLQSLNLCYTGAPLMPCKQ